MANEVAKTILEQLGGRAFCLMTGARKFVGDATGLMFRLPGAGGFCKAGINLVEIRLKNDLYTIRFWRARRGEAVKVAEHEGIYFDQLPEIFRKETGLETRLPRVRGINA